MRKLQGASHDVPRQNSIRLRKRTGVQALRIWDTALNRALLQSCGGRVKMGRTRAELVMSNFKWRHFEGEIILWAVRWYCRYGISYRDLEQMMGERGVPVDHSTI